MAAPDYILHNFWWKLLSLLLAALTWLTIQTALQRDETLRQTPVVGSFSRTFPAVPVTLLTSATNANRYLPDVQTVSVDISGPADQLQKLQEREIHAYIDVSDAGDEKQFRRPIQAQVPRDLKIDSLMPVNTKVERITTAK
ncbi:MAG: YbbR family protein [Pedosphaera sp.]|nr:YbbR family protein [Pedosphaera sp.]